MKRNNASIKEEYLILDKEYLAILQQIKELKNVSYDLMVEIHDSENTIKKSKDKIVELQELVDSLTATTNRNKDEYNALQSDIKIFETRKESLATELAQMKNKLMQLQIKKYVNEHYLQI